MVRIAQSRTPPICASPWHECQQMRWQKGETMPAPAMGCHLPSDWATARQSFWCRLPSSPPAQMSSTRGRTSRRTKSSSAARLMEGGGGGAWTATGVVERFSAWIEPPDEPPEHTERRMLLEAWLLWAVIWTWAVVLQGTLAPVWGRTSG